MNNWKFSVSLRLLTILVCLESINYIAFAQELISKQPSNCGSTNYYDGRLFGCAEANGNYVNPTDSTQLSCYGANKYFKLGQICVQDTTAVTAATTTEVIYMIQSNSLQKYDFKDCSAGASQVNNQFCFPKLNECTTNCIYLDSIKQTIMNPLINGLSIGDLYIYKTVSTSGSYDYKNGSALLATLSDETKASVETTIRNAFACYNKGANQHPKSCNYLINRCLSRGFSADVDDCKLLQSILYTDNVSLYDHITKQFTTNEIDSSLYVMVYDSDGEFVDFRELTTDLQICDKGSNDDNAFKTFGNSFDNRCNLDPTTIKSTSNFFEVYTKDTSSASTNKYSRLQAKVTYPDLLGNSDEIVVTRFYLYEKGFYDSVIQVATSINLKVDIENKSAYFQIKYEKLSSSSTTPITAHFSVSYESNTDNFWLIVKILFAIYMVFVLLWCMVRLYIWTMYNPRFDGQTRMMPGYSKKFVVNVIAILCDCYGEALMFFLFILSASIFIIAKASQTPNFVIPPRFSEEDVYTSFIVCCAFGFSFKLISTFYLIYKQSSCQIYFLDWEPKKKYQHAEEDKGQSSWRTLFVANEFNELAVYRLVSIEWTLFFMAMLMSGVEWENGASNSFSSSSDLPTMNIKINIIYKFFIDTSLFFFIALVQIVGRHLIKIWVPFKIQDFSDFCSVSNISIFIFDEYLHGYYLHGQSPDKYAEGNSLWLMSCLGEDVPFSLFQNYNQNPFGRQYPNQFNSSMMRQLQQPPMNQMGLQSARAQQGLGGQGVALPNQGWNQEAMIFKTQKAKRLERGLNNTSDQQIFEFFLSWDLREQIDYLFEIRQKSIEYLIKKRKELELAKKAQQQKLAMKGQEMEIEESKALKNQQEEKKEVEANQNYFADINLENGEAIFKPKMDGIFREVIRTMNQGSGQNSNVFEMEFMQRFLLHLPPPAHVDRRFNQNMFYVDRDNIFSSVLYSGYEFTLLYFYITVYSFVDLVSESTLIAVIVTYALDYIFKYIRQERGQQNLSSKAGIDDMFLI